MKLMTKYTCGNVQDQAWSSPNLLGPCCDGGFFFSFFYPECAFTDSKTEACDLCGPEESEHRRPPSRTVHPQHAGRTRAGQAA